MNPILFPPTETDFNTNGIGVLSDAVSCTVTEERNGAFELEMQYPVTGVHYGHIARRCILLAKPNPVDDAQPFRIYRITRPMSGVVTVYAAHISYDLSGIPVSPFTAASAPAAMAALASNAATDCHFSFWTDKTASAAMTVSAPASIRSLLGGSEGSLLDVYGGEYAFDRFTVRLYGQRGADRGVSIRYGKNLTDLTQEENCQSVYTGCYPYWAGQNGALVTLPEKILSAEGSYDFVKILPLDLSGEWQEAPTPDALRERAFSYMKTNRIGTPKVSLTVSFSQLEQTEEYKGTALLERVLLCDTVNVEFPALGVSATAKCVKTVYDCLLDRYDKVELGDARATIADTLVEQGAAIEKKPDKTFLQAAVDSATSQITGNKGGYVVLHSSTGAKEPDEVLIMDKPDIATATRVWRWNKSGLGYSSTGYNGPYGLAMTQDGAIVADFITAGTLNAALIRAGVLQDKTGKVFKLDLDAGTLDADFTSLKIAGKSTEEISKSEIEQSAKKISLSVTNNGTSSDLTLSYDGTTLSSQNVKITGFVTFESLITSGQSTINGDNITTGTIRAQLTSVSSDAGTVKIYSGGVYAFDKNGTYRIGLFTAPSSNNTVLQFKDSSGNWCGDLVGYRENGIGIVQLNLSESGFFRTGRIQTHELAIGNMKCFCDGYRALNGNAFVYLDGSSRVGCFEKLAIAGAAAQDVRWVWSGTLGGWVLSTSSSLN